MTVGCASLLPMAAMENPQMERSTARAEDSQASSSASAMSIAMIRTAANGVEPSAIPVTMIENAHSVKRRQTSLIIHPLRRCKMRSTMRSTLKWWVRRHWWTVQRTPRAQQRRESTHSDPKRTTKPKKWWWTSFSSSALSSC